MCRHCDMDTCLDDPDAMSVEEFLEECCGEEERDIVELPCGHHIDTFEWEGWRIVCNWSPEPDENFTVKPVKTDNTDNPNVQKVEK